MSKILDAFHKLNKSKVEPVYPVQSSDARTSKIEPTKFESAKFESSKPEKPRAQAMPIDPVSFAGSVDQARKSRIKWAIIISAILIVSLLAVVLDRLVTVSSYITTTKEQLDDQRGQIAALLEKLTNVQSQSEGQLKRLEDQLDGASKNVGLRIAKINDNIENELAKATSDVKRLRTEIDGIKSGNENIKSQITQLSKKMDGFAIPAVSQQGL